MPFPRVAEGSLLVYRLFEVADDIDLAAAERALAGVAERTTLRAGRAGFVDWPDRPLTVGLGPRTVALEDGTRLSAAAHVRLFAHGVASVRYDAALPAGADAEALATAVRRVAQSAALEAAARSEVTVACRRIAAALDHPIESRLFETYAVVAVRRLADGGSPADLGGEALARVLLGEPAGTPLSPQTVEDVTRHRFAYTTEDLVVLDWDTALVVDAEDDRSVADVLEVASAQLLELRYYDDLFERELLHVTGLLSRPRAGLAWLFLRRYGKILRRVQNLVVESAEVFERVDNALRVVGDLWLARVYRAAVERFRIPAWQADVARRQRAAADVAGLLREEASSMLGHVLETSIVGLIVFEILMAVLHR
ncbi:MAG: hypothetical protein IT460_12790 [Planctomycetes bacterium]|nr:hypothetical protein [Planctomycetota bacterium]